ncbi:hypothetical protein M758_1G192800 [Ceratodon purpureus]|nr:hypothetical protein M758_1G192800 [Ceratodon purpureus]
MVMDFCLLGFGFWELGMSDSCSLIRSSKSSLLDSCRQLVWFGLIAYLKFYSNFGCFGFFWVVCRLSIIGLVQHLCCVEVGGNLFWLLWGYWVGFGVFMELRDSAVEVGIWGSRFRLFFPSSCGVGSDFCFLRNQATLLWNMLSQELLQVG